MPEVALLGAGLGEQLAADGVDGLTVLLVPEDVVQDEHCLLYTSLVYRLQRIRTLLQLDLDDAAVRNVLRTGCILLEYYQGAF